MKLIPPLEPIRSDLESATNVLRDTMAQIEGPLGIELCQSVNGGKCVRSALVILVGKLFSSPAEPFYKLGAAVEVLHDLSDQLREHSQRLGSIEVCLAEIRNGARDRSCSELGAPQTVQSRAARGPSNESSRD